MPKFGPRWKVEFRRRREGKTDYRQRLRLLRSGIPRFVARVSLRNVVAQVVRATPSGDLTLVSAHSKELVKRGWKGDTSNLPAAYLVGLLCGYRATKKGVSECMLDVGLHVPTPQARVFGVLKGALDAGLKIPHGDGVLPAEERVRGEHIAKHAAGLRAGDEGAYRAKFSKYLERGIPPERLPEHFEQIKQTLARGD